MSTVSIKPATLCGATLGTRVWVEAGGIGPGVVEGHITGYSSDEKGQRITVQPVEGSEVFRAEWSSDPDFVPDVVDYAARSNHYFCVTPEMVSTEPAKREWKVGDIVEGREAYADLPARAVVANGRGTEVLLKIEDRAAGEVVWIDEEGDRFLSAGLTAPRKLVYLPEA